MNYEMENMLVTNKKIVKDTILVAGSCCMHHKFEFIFSSNITNYKTCLLTKMSLADDLKHYYFHSSFTKTMFKEFHDNKTTHFRRFIKEMILEPGCKYVLSDTEYHAISNLIILGFPTAHLYIGKNEVFSIDKETYLNIAKLYPEITDKYMHFQYIFMGKKHALSISKI